MGEIKSSSHSKWRCEYHLVFAPKYCRKEIYSKIKADIGQILRKLCDEKKVEILEANACPEHIHMLVCIPPYLSVAQFVRYLKGKSSLMIFDRHANLKYKYGSRHFWCRGYFAGTVGRNEHAIKEYISNQMEEDYTKDYALGWLENRKGENGLEVSTWENYENITKNHIAPYFKKQKLAVDEVTPRHIRDYFNYKAKSGRLLIYIHPAVESPGNAL